ncbi:MAG: FAD:protein FMN transferase [Myxococcota bacterium]
MPPPRLVIDAHTLRMIAIAFALLTALSVHRLYFADDPDAPEVLVVTGETMGTTYQIRVAGDGLGDRLERDVLKMADERLSEVDDWMSSWNPESEVSRFNAHASTQPFPVSYETAGLVAFAVELCKWTGGAYDISVGPLVGLWGFGNGARIGAPPSDAEIAEALGHMGARLLRIGRGAPGGQGFLRKNDPEVQIDLSSIAKGFGVDHLAHGLFDLGREDFLVEIGGEVYAAGQRPGGGPWRLAIEKPQDEGRAIQSIVELSNQGMASSGDYRIFYREGEQRISHTIDPRTGRPVEDGPAATTVIATSAAEADAWATALMVLGETEGLALADEWEVAALVLTRGEGDAIEAKTNRYFPETIDPTAPGR